MIPEVDAVAIEVKDNILNAYTVIGLDTPVIDAISYMANLLVLLIWLNLLIIQHVRVLSSGAHPHLEGSFLRPVNMRSTFVTLKQPNLPPSLLLPRPVMSLLALHIHQHLGSLILKPLIISLVIKTFFSSLTFPSPLPTITLANGSQTIAKGIGSVCLLPSLPLTSVLYVPTFPFNFISISKLTRDLHCVLSFSHNSVTLQDQPMGKTIGIGHESQGLFHLNSPLCSTACTSTEAPLLLHSRLGHSSLSKFRKFVPHFFSLSSLECESCQLRKYTRVWFPKRLDPRTKSPFELVHTDVWGLSRSTSTLRFCYFVTFIDDYY